MNWRTTPPSFGASPHRVTGRHPLQQGPGIVVGDNIEITIDAELMLQAETSTGG